MGCTYPMIGREPGPNHRRHPRAGGEMEGSLNCSQRRSIPLGSRLRGNDVRER